MSTRDRRDDLEEIDLSDMEDSDLDDDEAGMEEAENRIAEARHDRATSLDLSDCGGINSLPESLRGLTDLTDLDLSANFLDCLPDWVGDLTALSIILSPALTAGCPVGTCRRRTDR
jgi:hypothetical protein